MGGGSGWLSARQKQQKQQRKTSSKKATTNKKDKAPPAAPASTTKALEAQPSATAASVPSSTPAKKATTIASSATAPHPPMASSPRFAGVAITCGSFFSPFGKHQHGGLHPDDENWQPASSTNRDLDLEKLAQQTSTPHANATEEASSSSQEDASILKDPAPSSSSSPEKNSPPRSPPAFRTGTPIRGTNVAARAALFETSTTPNPPSPPGGGGGGEGMGGPPSTSTRLRHKAQRDFWERAFQASRDDDIDDEDGDDFDRNGDLVKKQQWLQSAFTPTGGGNMKSTTTDEDPTEDLTEEDPTEDASYSYHSVSPIMVRSISTSASPPLTSNDDAWRSAYAVWHRLGLLSWKPSSDLVAPPVVLGTAATTKGTVTESVEDVDLFHDSLMHLDEENCAPRTASSGKRSQAAAAAGAAAPTPVQQSREWHMSQSRNCPLLTVFGGNAGKVGEAVPFPPPPSTEVGEGGVVTTTTTPPRRLVTGPTGVLSPSQIYSNYVQAYTAYVQDRNSPEKARAHLEARRLLELSKKPLPTASSGMGGVGSVVAERLVAA